MEKAYPETYKALQYAERAGKRDEFIAQLKKERMGGGTTLSGTPAPAPTISKPTPVTVVEKKTSSTKPETKPAPAPLPPNATKLSDTQAQTKLQVQMVKLLGVSAQFLAQIDENSAKPNTNINGKMVANSLLNTANRQYGVAGVSY